MACRNYDRTTDGTKGLKEKHLVINGAKSKYFYTDETFPDAPNPNRLPTVAEARKALPICTGVLDYFPDALAAVAATSKAGNDQHNPGQPLHWNKSKSMDHADSLLRHLVDRGTYDNDGIRHSAKVAWRALALLQTEIENERIDVINSKLEGSGIGR